VDAAERQRPFRVSGASAGDARLGALERRRGRARLTPPASSAIARQSLLRQHLYVRLRRVQRSAAKQRTCHHQEEGDGGIKLMKKAHYCLRGEGAGGRATSGT